MNQAQRLAQARRVLSLAEAKSGVTSASHASTSLGWGVPGPLQTLLPSLAPGPLVVAQSTGIMLALAGQASIEGAWVAVVGMPWLGWGAAMHYGLEMSRLAHVPAVRGRGADVVSSLMDGFDVLLVGQAGLSVRDEKALGRRARSRGVSILAHSWAGAPELVARIDPGAGYANGVGHLTSIRLHLSYGSDRVDCLANESGLELSPQLVAL